MKITTKLITAALFLFPLSVTAETKLLIGTGGTGGTYYPVGVGIAKLITDTVPKLSVDAVTSGGSTDNVRLIKRGETDFGITNGVVGTLAVSGSGPFNGKKQTNLRSVFSLWGNTEHHLALNSASKTGTIDDLASLPGKYNIGGRKSGARTAATRMLKLLGHNPKTIEMEFIASYSEAAKALQDNRVSAVNIGGGIPVAAVTEIFAALGTEKVTILEFTPQHFQKLDQKNPGLYYPQEIPAGTYPGQKQAIRTAEYANLLVVDAAVSEDIVYQLTKAVFENLEAVYTIHPATKSITLATAINGLSVPLHPGAIRYYKEKGLTIPAHLIP